MQGLAGIAGLLLLAWIFSENRKAVPWRAIAAGLVVGAATGGQLDLKSEASSSMDALTQGTLGGAQLLVNIVAMLVVFVALATLSERSRLLMSYALCGFANFGSLGIMIGGMSAMCPERRSEIVPLGMKSIVAGTLATCLTAATVGLIV